MWTVPENHAHALSSLARELKGFLWYLLEIGKESNTVLREPTIRATVSYNKIGLTVLTAGIYPLTSRACELRQ